MHRRGCQGHAGPVKKHLDMHEGTNKMKTIIGIHCPDRKLARAVGDVLLDMAESAERGSSERVSLDAAAEAVMDEAKRRRTRGILLIDPATVDLWTDMVDRSQASLVVVDDLSIRDLVERIDDMDAAGAETLLVRIGCEGRKDALPEELFHLDLDGDQDDSPLDYAVAIVESLCDPESCGECPFRQPASLDDLRAELEDLLDRAVGTMDLMDGIEPGSGVEVLDERLARLSAGRGCMCQAECDGPVKEGDLLVMRSSGHVRPLGVAQAPSSFDDLLSRFTGIGGLGQDRDAKPQAPASTPSLTIRISMGQASR
jgi:hypothetical protein